MFPGCIHFSLVGVVMINCSSNLTMGKWYRATRSRLVLLPPLKQLLYPSLSRAGNLGHLTWVRHSNCKSSATHSCHCEQHQFHLSRQRYGCQCVGFVTCMQMLMHAIAHMGCMVTIRESALKIDPGREIPFRMGDSVPRQYCLLPGFSVGCSAN